MAILTDEAREALALLAERDSAVVLDDPQHAPFKEIIWNGGRCGLDTLVFLRLVKRQLISRISPTRWQINDDGRNLTTPQPPPAANGEAG